MAFEIQKLLDESIIIDTHTEPLDPAGFPEFAQRLAEMALAIEGPIYRIVDLRGMSFSFSTLVHVLAEETRAGRPGSAGDPRVCLALVATGQVAELIATSAKQDQYGALDVPVFATVEAALADARERIGHTRTSDQPAS